MAKRKENEPPSFEDALTELEAITRDLEEGSCRLDESLRKFEQGVALLRRCYGLLDAAERKIALLTGFDGDGNPVLEPFDASATAEQGTAGRRKARREPAAASENGADSEDRSPAERGLF
jgi:exodeoxyribonuclease VII small subunit